MRAPVAQAYDTLDRGTRRLTALAAASRLADPWPVAGTDRVRIRYIGNCMRELDRFLHILIDELVEDAVGDAAPASPTPSQLTLAATTAGKLGHHATPYRDRAADQFRLHALARTRLCLSHGDGRANRPDRRDGDRMTAGWFAPASTALRRYAIGERLRPSGHDLIGISAFYRQLADRIVAGR
ncbi:hypothetical protein [Sphingomonas sp. CLY1604]|uniref:hypothetical protein n=1 Tax=Sphingomonas sp. CLY1604 TaxID=3457786 RepID=UPI003FD7DCBA